VKVFVVVVVIVVVVERRNFECEVVVVGE